MATTDTKTDSEITDEILIDDDKRLILFPIKYPDMYELYKKATSAIWVVEELDMSRDRQAYEDLEPDVQNFIAYVLSFFSQADCLVIENIAANFGSEVKPLEARLFYTMQNMIEGVHAETYAQLLQTIIRDEKKRNKLINGVQTFKCIGAKAKWVERYMNREQSFARRLLAFIILEGLFFSAAFCAIFYLKKRSIEMEGLLVSNEFISRDEGMHRDFGVLLYRKYLPNTKLPEADVVDMFQEAVEIERACCMEALPVRLIGMNADSMADYVKFIADGLMVDLGYSPIYNKMNPYNWMESISLQEKSNMFEKRITSYSKAGVLVDEKENVFSLTAEF